MFFDIGLVLNFVNGVVKFVCI